LLLRAAVSRDNVQTLHESFEAWNSGDLEGWLRYLGPEFEYRTAQLFPGMEPVYRGREGMTRFWNALREPWEKHHA
jgi:ketosteroid isomerase-like protein